MERNSVARATAASTVAAAALVLVCACAGKSTTTDSSTASGAGGGGGSRPAPGGSANGGSGGSGADEQPPLGESVWFPRGSWQLTGSLHARTLGRLLGMPPFPFTFVSGRKLLLGVGPTNTWLFDAPTSMSEAATALVATSDATLLAAVGCSAATPECRAALPDGFGRRAFRRPLTQEERDALLAVEPDWSEMDRLRGMVQWLLVSPAAFMVTALGKSIGDGAYALDGYEIASLLAYGLTGLPPDDELLDAAESLTSEAARREQASRLLASDDGRAGVDEFFRSWFGVRGAGELWVSDYDAEVARSMLEETNRLIEDVVYARNAPVSELLTADYSFVNPTLGKLYGLELAGDDFVRIELASTPRRGILHHASWLTSSSFESGVSYGRRGVSALGLLCESIPAPPPDVAAPGQPTPPGQTRRQAYEDQLDEPTCQACHSLFDPVAFAFDRFDTRGGYRDADELGGAIDTAGTVRTSANQTYTFTSSTDLVQQLATDPLLDACFVRTLTSSFVGLRHDDAGALSYAALRQRAGGKAIASEAILEWAASDHFIYRSDRR